ncbi:MAG: DUF4019 domain-containing protein [Halobacteriovoraceae bacterium]|mgnify:CR=1 FL=1|jgi:hypothetical protein|nr:DUF4019 domain-containing protein [Halobacteriovoraceae bacterium]
MNLFLKHFVFINLLILSANCHGKLSPEKRGTEAASTWVTLIDQEKYGDSWKTASRLFKNSLSSKAWSKQIAPIRKKLGKLIRRSYKSATYYPKLPNAPAGKYVVVLFKVDFENQKNLTETITPMLDADGVWRVSGYYIKK